LLSAPIVRESSATRPGVTLDVDSTKCDAEARESASQAEYAGSIPVIGYINPQIKACLSFVGVSAMAALDRRLTWSGETPIVKPFAGSMTGGTM
jgi:hypothetical protein